MSITAEAGTRPSTGYKWVFLAVCCLGVFGPAYTQFQFPPLAEPISRELSLSPTQFSSAFTAPMIPGFLLSLVAGLLVDRYGYKMVIGIGILITAASTWLRLGAGDYGSVFWTMLFTGVGITVLNANAAKILSTQFRPDQVTLAVSIFLATGSLGQSVGSATSALLPSVRAAFLVAAVVSLVAALAWWLLIRPAPTPAAAAPGPTMSVRAGIVAVARSRTIWMAAATLFCAMGAMISMSSRLPAALIWRGVGPATAGGLAAIITIGGLVGSIVVPQVAVRLPDRRIAYLTAGLLGAVSLAFSWRLPVGPVLIVALVLTGMLLGGVLPLLMSLPVQLSEVGPALAGTAGGLLATAQLLGAVVLPSYLFTPIAGDNHPLFFCLAAIPVLGIAGLSWWLPGGSGSRARA